MTGLIGCIIPCYNLGRFVETAVMSAMNQIRPFHSIIVLDDRSTDDSWSYIEKLPSQVQVIRFTENRGYARTRNIGALVTSTKYMVFLDADDWLYSNYTQEVLPTFDNYAHVGIVCPEVDADGITVAGGPWPAPHDDSLERLREQNYVWAASAVNRHAFMEVGGFDYRFEPAADWALWYQIRERGWRIKGLHQPLWHWRDRPDGLHTTIRDEDIRNRMRKIWEAGPSAEVS
jgi:glycosyltransferase involved in cell wall biosynthesis